MQLRPLPNPLKESSIIWLPVLLETPLTVSIFRSPLEVVIFLEGNPVSGLEDISLQPSFLSEVPKARQLKEVA